MGFGNPYGDEWNMEILAHWTESFQKLGIKIIPVSDIMGEATPDKIYNVFNSLINEFPAIEFGLHLHSQKESIRDKLEAAYESGIRRFDTVLGGYGGCPMTGKELIGNLPLRYLLSYCEHKGLRHGLDINMVAEAESFEVF